MSELAEFVLEAVRSALRGTMMELAGWAIVLAIVAVCAAVVYFLLRAAGVNLSVRSGLPYEIEEDPTGGLPTDPALAEGALRSGRPLRRFRRGPVSVTYESDPQVVHLDQATLDRARQKLAEGLDLDDTCRAIHPEYARWDPFLQKAFRSALRASLEAEPPDAGPG
ncbi:MAG TPA: hypothetical protein VFG78_11080 [Gemmatimonadota bacterium]|nr:hypothetical protein [Gemmatimonadota bacterium]